MESGTRSVRTALRVVEEVSGHGALGVSELARRLDLPKSTVQRTLATLRSAGWLRQDARARWALTLRCASIGRSVLRGYDVRRIAQPIALDLRDRTHETVRYFLIEGESLVLLGSAESDLAVRPVEAEFAGTSLLHATAVGRAALATMPVEQVEQFLERPLTPVTPKTITDPATLRVEIDATRRRGWGKVREDLYLDVGGVAAAAPLHDDIIVGIGISYPLHRTTERTTVTYGLMVREAVATIAASIDALLQPEDPPARPALR
jgi:IclR family transcriptional regulator, acetate operon repressor